MRSKLRVFWLEHESDIYKIANVLVEKVSYHVTLYIKEALTKEK